MSLFGSNVSTLSEEDGNKNATHEDGKLFLWGFSGDFQKAFYGGTCLRVFHDETFFEDSFSLVKLDATSA